MIKFKLMRKKIPHLKNRKKILLALTISLLLVVGGARAFVLYGYYNRTNSETATINNMLDSNIESVLKESIINANKEAFYNNKLESLKLQSNLMETNGEKEVYQSIVKGDYNPEVYQTIKDTYSRLFVNNHNEDTTVVLGTKKGVFFAKSTNHGDIIDKSKDDAELISWADFINNIENPEVANNAYESIGKLSAGEPVILKMDDENNDGKIYTVDDVVKLYMEKGERALDGLVFLNLATITDDGDMFGEYDDYYMNKNENVNKIYVYQSVNIGKYMSDDLKVLDELKHTNELGLNIVNNETKVNILSSAFAVILIGVAGICLMVVYKDIDDEDEEKKLTTCDKK